MLLISVGNLWSAFSHQIAKESPGTLASRCQRSLWFLSYYVAYVSVFVWRYATLGSLLPYLVWNADLVVMERRRLDRLSLTESPRLHGTEGWHSGLFGHSHQEMSFRIHETLWEDDCMALSIVCLKVSGALFLFAIVLLRHCVLLFVLAALWKTHLKENSSISPALILLCNLYRKLKIISSTTSQRC